jgi:hypothetical protein
MMDRKTKSMSKGIENVIRRSERTNGKEDQHIFKNHNIMGNKKPRRCGDLVDNKRQSLANLCRDHDALRLQLYKRGGFQTVGKGKFEAGV